MRGAAQGLQDQVQAEGVAVAAYFALVQFQLVQHRLQAVMADTLGGHCFQHPQYQRFQFLDPLGVAALYAAAEHHFPHAVLQAAQRRGRLAQGGGFQRLLQGRGAVVQQHAGQQLRLQQLLEVGALSQQPAHDQVGLPGRGAFFVKGVGALDPQGCRQPALGGYADGFMQCLEAPQGALLEYPLVFEGGDIAEGHEDGVAGVIMAAVERHQLWVSEVGNMCRIAAAVVVIGGGGEQLFTQLAPQH